MKDWFDIWMERLLRKNQEQRMGWIALRALLGILLCGALIAFLFLYPVPFLGEKTVVKQPLIQRFHLIKTLP